MLTLTAFAECKRRKIKCDRSGDYPRIRFSLILI